MMARSYEEIKQDAMDAIRALRKLDWTRERIMQVIRFHVTDEELDIIIRYYEGRHSPIAGYGHIAYAGMKMGFFGIPIVLDAGEVENHLF